MAMKNAKPLMEINGISLNFGGLSAIRDLDLTVNEGEIYSIIGPNGAGKTSLLNCINGIYRPQRGKVLFKGKEIQHLKPHQRAKLGIGRTFQKVELFKGMTVLENIKLGGHNQIKGNLFGSLIRLGKSKREELTWRGELEKKVIDFLDLSAFRYQLVGLLPYGFQKRVDLGRALSGYPEVMLLDEPMGGMNVEEKEDMASFLMEINQDLGITIIWIEHDLRTVMDLSNRVCVLSFGSKIAEGTFMEIRNDPKVIEAYLGMEESK